MSAGPDMIRYPFAVRRLVLQCALDACCPRYPDEGGELLKKKVARNRRMRVWEKRRQRRVLLMKRRASRRFEQVFPEVYGDMEIDFSSLDRRAE